MSKAKSLTRDEWRDTLRAFQEHEWSDWVLEELPKMGESHTRETAEACALAARLLGHLMHAHIPQTRPEDE